MASGRIKPSRGVRLDRLLVERGLLPDLRSAGAWILARRVRVNGAFELQPGARVPPDADLEIPELEQRYVSRGGEKLEAALAKLAADPRGLTVLDAGASTGGFTDCLLQHGAARVYAVDVGFGQLRGKLASDPRVVSLERTNIAELDARRFDPPLQMAVVDLSYLSLTAAIPQLARLFPSRVLMVCLLKPLFEGIPERDRRSFERFPPIFGRIRGCCETGGLRLTGVCASPILGSRGTVEFFVRVESHAQGRGAEDALDGMVGAAIADARTRFPQRPD